MNRLRARALAGLAGAAAVAVLATGCGVPTGGSPTVLPPSAVPFGLLSAVPSSAAPPSTSAEAGQPRVYLVGPEKQLVPRNRSLPHGTVREELEGLLHDLAAGPTSGERLGQLSTVLPPDVHLTVAQLQDGTATVDIVGTTDPSGRESRLAVGQIVLTATSLPGVSAVLLRRNGDPVEAPLPSGQLTSDPLTAEDYRPLLQAPPG